MHPLTQIFIKLWEREGSKSPVHYIERQVDEHVRDNILFLHAFSGCDTTYAFFRQGKMKFLKLLNKNKQLGQLVSIFRDENASQDDVDKAGQHVVAFIYAAKASEQTSLDALWYQLFAQSIIKIGFDLASLPHTTAAAHQHSLRMYHQVQFWCGKENNTLEWG
jgi:hypothetical protein